ncbi:MAG: NAD-dependent deacylase [Deltaproteobacteria bacterium]|nr:NAD-dependent deacylase [Deltaproteobacteria bacterium]
MQTEIEKLKNRLRSARSLVILTGAGVSAESGVPTFRGADGLWRSHNPQELATPGAFEADPFLVWEWYDWRRSIISKIQPNPAHYAIAELEKRYLEFTLITQNVDGLHAVAGSKKVIELHGSIWTVRCVECGNSSENRDVPIKILPRCPCGGLLRPAVVWFGEPLPEEALFRAFEASSNAAVMLVVGTSGVVQPAASLALRARDAGAFVAEINPEATPLSSIVDLRLPCKAGELMPTLL